MSAIEEIRILLYRVACREPVRTSFGVMHDRPALLVRLQDADGAIGWGEVWCNFPACGAEHRARLLETVVAPLLLGRSFERPAAAWQELSRQTHLLALQTGEAGPLAQVLAGVDVAMWDLAARRAGVPLYRFLRTRAGTMAENESVSVPAYASGINPSAVGTRISQAQADGFHAFKVKVGFQESVDLRNLEEALACLQPAERMALDANQSWEPSRAIRMAKTLNDKAITLGHQIAWLEEPMASDQPWSAWQELRESGAPPLAAGENLRGNDVFEQAIRESALAVIQPDLCKWGGFTGCLPVALLALQSGKRYCPHYLGGGIGLLASAHLLAAVGGDGLLEIDVNENPLREELAQPFPVLKEGQFPLPAMSGLGVEPEIAENANQPSLEIALH